MISFKQVLNQRIDIFTNTSENVCNNNNDAKPFIQNSIGELKRYWNDLKRQANELEQNIEQTKQYFIANEQVNRNLFLQILAEIGSRFDLQLIHLFVPTHRLIISIESIENICTESSSKCHSQRTCTKSTN